MHARGMAKKQEMSFHFEIRRSAPGPPIFTDSWLVRSVLSPSHQSRSLSLQTLFREEGQKPETMKIAIMRRVLCRQQNSHILRLI